MIRFPEIQDIAPPVEPVATPGTPWGWWVAIGALTLLGLALLTWLLLALKGRARFPGLPDRSPDQVALRAIAALRERVADLEGGSLSPTEFANELSGVVRVFLHRQTGVLANFSTSPEILGDRRRAGQPPPPPAVAAFRRVLLECDRMKFGGPDAPDAAAFAALLDDAAAAVRLASAPAPAGDPPPPAAAKPQTAGTNPPPLPATSSAPAPSAAVSPVSPPADAPAA